MIKAYINYPNPHITAHRDSDCGKIQSQNKSDQRYCVIDSKTISQELQNFRDKKYPFGADDGSNDMWLEINFNDREFELAVLEHIRILLSEHYRPFAEVRYSIHC